MTKIIFTSDTHCQHAQVKIEQCDILIHCGDSTATGTIPEIKSFLSWFEQQPAAFKLCCAGNHDFLFERDPVMARMLLSEHPTIDYLQDSMNHSMIRLPGDLKIYGSPHQKIFHNWAFNLSDSELKKKWEMIPEGIDILVTHSPPYGIMDFAQSGDHIGCRSLKYEVMNRVKPKIHVFGHNHEGYGTYKFEDTLYINASTCDRKYRPTNPPIIVELP